MRIAITLTGTSPLVMANERLADPMDGFSKEIAKLTSKKKMTEEDQTEVARLKFMAGLYVGKAGIVMPSRNLVKCFRNGAVIRKKGKDIERGLLMTAQEWPVIYDGPRDLDGLWADERFHFRAMVKIGRARIPHMRPHFPEWAIRSEWELMTSVLDLDEFEQIVSDAGLVEGLGDYRTKGGGRFTAEVAEVKATRKVA